MAEPLADVSDVAEVLGRDLTDSEETRVAAILVKASELFRRYSGQQFTAGTSTVLLTVSGGVVTLPQRPVTAVTAVTSPDGATPIGATIVGPKLTVTDLRWPQVLVTYTHGGVVPDLVRLTVADVVQKVLTIPEQAGSGVQQFSTTKGPFTESYTYAQWALGGQAAFAPADIAVAKSYRSTMLGSIHVR